MAGEKIVTPSSIVKLSFKARYVYPSSVTAPAFVASSNDEKAVLTNGEVHSEETNGEANGKEHSVAEVENTVVKAEKKKTVKANKIEDEEEKDEEKDKKVWPANGFAHAPRWPQVCPTIIVESHRLIIGVAAQAQLSGLTG